ncbi:MAG: ABC transporter substrate-binding protein [Chloroflexota bacterium]
MDKKSWLISAKRTGALILISSMVLAGCDSGTSATPTTAPVATNTAVAAANPTDTASTGTGEPTAAATMAATAEATAGGGTESGGVKLNKDVSGEIEMWHFWSSPVRRNAIRRVIGICQAELPNIKVTEVAKPFGDIWTANTAAVAAGSGMPDVIVADRPKLPADAANNIYTDLQDRATKDGITGDTFWPFTWKQTLYKDHTYGLPFETDVRVLFYNKNAFKDAGLDPEKPPKTWDELMAAADKLDKKNDDGTYKQIAFFPIQGNAGPEIWGYTNGVEWVTPDGKPQIDTPQAAETLNWIKTWVDRYGGWQNIQTFRAGFQSPPNDAFMSGKVAMIVDVNGYASQLNFYNPRYTGTDGKAARLDWGVSDMPYKTKQASWSGGFSLSMPRGAKNPDAAWEFMKCASGEKGAASWSRDTYAMSANKAAATDPTLMADPAWAFFLKAMDYSTGGNFLEGYPNWGEQLDQRYEKVWTGEMTAEQAVKEAQQAVLDQIAK